MKIVSHVSEKKFFVTLSEQEFKQILGITRYHIKDELDIDLAILRDEDLKISSAFETSESLKNIVNRESFQKLKSQLLSAARVLEDAETKFTNLTKAIIK